MHPSDEKPWDVNDRAIAEASEGETYNGKVLMDHIRDLTEESLRWRHNLRHLTIIFAILAVPIIVFGFSIATEAFPASSHQPLANVVRGLLLLIIGVFMLAISLIFFDEVK